MFAFIQHQTHPDKATSLSKLAHQFDTWLLSHRLHILGISFALLMTTLDTSVPRGGLVFFPWFIWDYAGHYEYLTLLRCFFHDPKLSGKYFLSGVGTPMLLSIALIFYLTQSVLIVINIPDTDLKTTI